MKQNNSTPIYPRVSPTDDSKQVYLDYVVTALEAVIHDPGKYLPDSVYTEYPGEIVIHLPLNGAAYVEASTETYITK